MEVQSVKEDVFKVLQGIAIGIGVFAVVLGMVTLMLAEFQEQAYLPRALAENITLNNGTAVSLTHARAYSFSSLTNATNTSIVIATANYSTDLVAGTVTLEQAAKGSYDGNLSTANYVYRGDTAASNVSGIGLSASADLSGWLGLIVLVIVFGLLISLLLFAFAWKAAKSSA